MLLQNLKGGLTLDSLSKYYVGAAAVAAEVATAFKCSVTLRGANVADGLRALIDAGFAKSPMPAFVRDAPTKGSMTLTVDEREAFAEPLLLD